MLEIRQTILSESAALLELLNAFDNSKPGSRERLEVEAELGRYVPRSAAEILMMTTWSENFPDKLRTAVLENTNAAAMVIYPRICELDLAHEKGAEAFVLLSEVLGRAISSVTMVRHVTELATGELKDDNGAPISLPQPVEASRSAALKFVAEQSRSTEQTLTLLIHMVADVQQQLNAKQFYELSTPSNSLN